MNTRGRHLLWVCLVLLVSPPPDARAERLPIKTYTTADGLAHNHIKRIVKDSRGFLWFCTADGLSRFDGYTFTNFGVEQGLPHSTVNDLLETRAGEYWVATDGGLARFYPKSRPMFSVIVPDDDDRRARAITVLREARDGTIWVGTNKGLYRLEHVNGRRSLRPIDIQLPRENPEQRMIADILEDGHDSLWIAAPSGLYRRWSDGSAARYTTRDGLPNDFLQDVFEDRAGQLWVGTRLEGFFRFSADATHTAPVVDLKLTYRPQDPYGLPGTSWVSQLFESSDRRFFVATPRGLVEFFRGADEQRRFRSYGTTSGFSDRNITSVNEDLGGNLWLGTLAGAMRLARVGFSTYGKTDGIGEVTAVFEDRSGRLCFRGSVLGDARTSVFEGAKLDLLRGDEPILHRRLGCLDARLDWFKPNAVTDFGWVGEHVTLQTRSGEWWVGTGEGLYRFPSADTLTSLKTARPTVVYTTKDGLVGLQVYRLFEDSKGNVWFSTTSPAAAGMARWDRLSDRVINLSAAPGLSALKDDWAARSFGQDGAGNVWIGFTSELARYKDGQFRVFTVADGLPPGAIREMHVDRSGRLWLASGQSGLVRVDGGGTERPTFVNYTTAQGLSSNNIEIITEDRSGHIYVGGGRGLDRIDPATGRVRHFTSADGLPSGIFVAAFHDRNGTLWFGTLDGLARFDAKPEKPPEAAPVLISGFRVRGVPQLVSALGEHRMTFPDFAPHQNQLQIDFIGLSFSSGEVLRYQYQLQGADADWSASSEQRSVTYASLPAGRHRFLVRAVNSDGLVSPDPATVSFTILRPVWQRWWFLSLTAMVIILTPFALYRSRVSRILEVASLRTRIATDLHDDIGANLTRIALLSEVAAMGRPEDGPLASITRIARESVSSMSDIVWAVNPKRESLIDLTRRMRQHADEVFTQRGIDLRFTVPAAAVNPKLGMDVRRDLLLIFKEAVNNAARHSGCSAVSIDLRLDGARLVLRVADNGTGFDNSIEGEGQGLASMHRRAIRLGGRLEITPGSGSGTTLEVSVPI